MVQTFPAVLVGGPPHSGKSVLTYHLSQALRECGVDHYVLRACPDGEGDWAQEAQARLVVLIRHKGEFTGPFVERVCRDLAGRHLPLLVDVGGKPTQEQEVIFDHCTHAILLAPDKAGLDQWRGLADQHGLPRLAELISMLHGADQVAATSPVLAGRIAGLERQGQVQGPVLATLVEQVQNLFAYPPATLREKHLTLAPTELVIELDRFGRWLGLVGQEDPKWTPADLTPLLAQLPDGEALALYGRGPNWLYCAVALHVAPAPFYQFDARLGWVQPKRVELGEECVSAALHYQMHNLTEARLLTFTIDRTEKYLDYHEQGHYVAPTVPTESGLILSGPLPFWLMNGLAIAYRSRPWLALYQPPLGGAVVVASRDPSRPVGELIQITLA